MRFVHTGTLLAALLLAGCSDEPITAPTDASVATDLGVDAAPPSDASMTCDAGAPPIATLPTIAGAMVVTGGDGGTTPTPGGGDPTGRWVMSAATLYWPPVARGQVNPEGGAITGTGWVVFEGGGYRLATDLVLRVDTTAAGVVARPSTLASRGSFTAAGGSLSLSPECSASSGMGPGGNSVGFSRDGADRGRLFVNLTGAAGTAALVFDLRRVP